ncbi:hypothetical protein R3P38DRAFT_3352919 [Favolaschia claudopus]|uniref:F-box domain-containing protein n=1 Tax=Favolaschia claudopus TaxID=2862362 RepID=A0AAW0BY41_9AGAR
MSSHLPPDLEREIFEICALSWPLLIPKFMLVAQRVKAWVEPLLYRTIPVSPVPLDGFRSRRFPAYPASRVTSLILAKPAGFFRSCTNLENLYIADNTTALIPHFDSVSVTRLRAPCEAILRNLPPTHHFFSRLTHLELADKAWRTNFDPSQALAALPHLTHLASSWSHFIPRLLQSCRTLRVLICLHNPSAERFDRVRPFAERLAHDIRFVVASGQYGVMAWYMSVQGGVDYWRRAEVFIEARRTRKIDTELYLM